ncbi:MAG: agmatinase [Desulfobacterales bacterium]
MKTDPQPFLNPDPEYTALENAAAVILPIPYEGGVSYGKGAAAAPAAVIAASHQLEFYDEVLEAEPYRMGIATVMPPRLPSDPAKVQAVVYRSAKELLDSRKFVVLIGGDHSVSGPFAQALKTVHGSLSVIQLDAHADLRDSYDNSRFSHACVMARIREITTNTLQFGIRSMSLEEAQRIERENIAVCTMSSYRNGAFDIDAALAGLPEPVFLTIDVDAFDWSVIRSTGTPEPGGFTWDEALHLLKKIFDRKNVVAFDVVELSTAPRDLNSPFAVAKLIYKLLGFKLAGAVRDKRLDWPVKPRGSVFDGGRKH